MKRLALVLLLATCSPAHAQESIQVGRMGDKLHLGPSDEGNVATLTYHNTGSSVSAEFQMRRNGVVLNIKIEQTAAEEIITVETEDPNLVAVPHRSLVKDWETIDIEIMMAGDWS